MSEFVESNKWQYMELFEWKLCFYLSIISVFIKAFQDVSQENFLGIQEHSKYDVFLFFKIIISANVALKYNHTIQQQSINIFLQGHKREGQGQRQ